MVIKPPFHAFVLIHTHEEKQHDAANSGKTCRNYMVFLHVVLF